MRIAKYIAHCGFCSRRDAERLILQGKVSLNGEILAKSCEIDPDNDVVNVNNVRLSLANQSPRLWKFYKPKGMLY